MYTAREVASVLGVPPGRLRAYLRAGLVSPRRGQRGELRFSFQDLVVLRRVEGLVDGRIPPGRVHRALRRLREGLPPGAPMMQVQLEADGGRVVVSDGKQRWEPGSGQVVFDFKPDRAEDSCAVHELRTKALLDLGTHPPSTPEARPAPRPVPTADELYEMGYAAEEAGDSKGAMAEYRRAIARDPQHTDAQVNLGRLLHEAGRPEEAVARYRAALAVRANDPIAAFNLGVALEDLGRKPEAIAAYRQAIAAEPDNADAHYNIALLYDQTGETQSAFRHRLIYRRLTRKRR
jgi:tetratricopeptide (TPR) repeat protein